MVLQFIIKRDEPFSTNQLEELPESVEATLVVLVIEKINPELPASISNVGVKACIEGKQKASFK